HRWAACSKAAGRETPPSAKGAVASTPCSDTATIHVSGDDIKAVHCPHCHTDGDAVIFFPKSNVVHMGDDLFFGQFPFVDLDNGGSVRGLIKHLETIYTMLDDGTNIDARHCALSDKKAPRAWI